MQVGDLVKLTKRKGIGIIIEIFGDLDPANPWMRVLFTHPHETYQWCKKDSLLLVSTKKSPTLLGAINESGSL